MFLRYSFVIFLFFILFFVLNTGVGGLGDSGRTRARTASEELSRPLRSNVDPYVGRKSSEVMAGEMMTFLKNEVRFVPISCSSCILWASIPPLVPVYSSRMEEAPDRLPEKLRDFP